jgi:hypothetical protein
VSWQQLLVPTWPEVLVPVRCVSSLPVQGAPLSIPHHDLQVLLLSAADPQLDLNSETICLVFRPGKKTIHTIHAAWLCDDAQLAAAGVIQWDIHTSLHMWSTQTRTARWSTDYPCTCWARWVGAASNDRTGLTAHRHGMLEYHYMPSVGKGIAETSRPCTCARACGVRPHPHAHMYTGHHPALDVCPGHQRAPEDLVPRVPALRLWAA